MIGGMTIAATLIAGAPIPPFLLAQTASAASPLAFEVASVKPSKPQTGRIVAIFDYQPGGRFTATSLWLRTLIKIAYGRLPGFDALGGPGWIDTDRFDITAKAEGTATRPQINEMLQALLADRFKLVVHHESRALDAFAVRLARSDGRLGPQMRRVDTDCAAIAAAREQAAVSAAPTSLAAQLALPPSTERPTCAMRSAPGKIIAGSDTVATLATALSTFLGRTTVDRTGLTGRFDMDLQWTMGPPGGADLSSAAAGVLPSGTSLVTAIQEQLGLRLEPTKEAVDVLVIDRVEQPTED